MVKPKSVNALKAFRQSLDMVGIQLKWVTHFVEIKTSSASGMNDGLQGEEPRMKWTVEVSVVGSRLWAIYSQRSCQIYPYASNIQESAWYIKDIQHLLNITL